MHDAQCIFYAVFGKNLSVIIVQKTSVLQSRSNYLVDNFQPDPKIRAVHFCFLLFALSIIVIEVKIKVYVYIDKVHVKANYVFSSFVKDYICN